MKSLALAFVVGLGCLAGCSAAPPAQEDTVSEAIIGTQRSAAAYTEAVRVQVNNSAGDFCSGVLIAPRVVMTASHCVSFNPDTDGVGPRGTWTIVAPFAVGGPQTITASSGEPYDPAFYSLSVASYDSNDSAMHDIGFIYLDTAVTGVTFPTWSNTRYPTMAGQQVSAVGRQSVSASAGLVLSAAVTLSQSTAMEGYPHDNVTPRVTDGGDSGGPLFLEGTHVLVGTETRFDPTNVLDYWSRLDTDVYSFIQNHVIAEHGGATNDAVEDFLIELSAAMCGRAAACCIAQNASYVMNPLTCRNVYGSIGFDSTGRSLLEANRAHLSINANSRSTCLTNIGNTASCNVTSAQLATNIAACVGAVVGNAATGTSCISSSECAGSAVCQLAVDGTGTCQPLKAIGASCEVAYKGSTVDERYDLAQELCSKRGDGGAYCDGFDFVAGSYITPESGWTCKASTGTGTSCGTDAGCSGSVCSPATHTCVASTAFAPSAVCTAFQ